MTPQLAFLIGLRQVAPESAAQVAEAAARRTQTIEAARAEYEASDACKRLTALRDQQQSAKDELARLQGRRVELDVTISRALEAGANPLKIEKELLGVETSYAALTSRVARLEGMVKDAEARAAHGWKVTRTEALLGLHRLAADQLAALVPTLAPSIEAGVRELLAPYIDLVLLADAARAAIPPE